MVSSVRPANRATCVIDQLESRYFLSSYFPIQIDDAHSFNVNDRASEYSGSMLVLKDKRFLFSWDTEGRNETVFKMIPASSSFNHGHAFHSRQMTPVTQLSDGSILTRDYDRKYYKLLLSGKLDSNFGTGGFIKSENYVEPLQMIELNGRLVRYVTGNENNQQYLIIDQYDLNGKLKSHVENNHLNLDPIANYLVLPDGDIILHDNFKSRVSRFNLDGTPDLTFGENGILDLYPRYRKWAKRQTWFEFQPDAPPLKHRAGYVPVLGIQNIKNGSQYGTVTFTLKSDLVYTDSIPTREATSNVHSDNYIETTLMMVYGNNGGYVAMHPKSPKWTQRGYSTFMPPSDDPGPGVLSYSSVTLSTGDQYYLDLTDPKPFYKDLMGGGFYEDRQGGFYITGIRYDESYQFTTTTVIHAQPFVSTISGRMYNDQNGDGIQQTGEKLLSGKQVYIDENGNGKYDVDELITLTDSKGHYQFNGLYRGEYKVRAIPPIGKRITTATFATGSITLKLGESKWGEIGISV